MTKSSNTESTSMAVVVIGIIGAVLNIIHFILASNLGEFTTSQLIQIVILAICNISLMVVGAINNNSKDTFAIPYLAGMIAFVMFSYEYINIFVEKGTTYMTKYLMAGNVGTAMFYFIGCIVFLIAYFCLTGKIRNSKIGLILLSIMCGGFVYSFFSSAPKTAYQYLRAEHLNGYGIGLNVAAILVLKYITVLTIYAGMIVLQLVQDKKKVEKEA